MKVVFLSNFFNHHQAPLSDALWEQTGGQYLFIETESMPRERRELGYPALERPYVLSLQEHESTVLRHIRTADVVIAGSAPEWLIRKRIQTGKLLMRFTERPLRNGMEMWKYIPRLFRWHWRNPPGSCIYLLCASAYAAGDYEKFGLFRDKCWCWGYFPPFQKYALPQLMEYKDHKRILWCGRLLELKHPDAALRAAQRLKQEGVPFSMDLIGSGEQEETLQRLVREWELGDCVHLLGAMTTEEVRRAMEHAGIFLFTSDAREGWGAVVNEAMNSGCAVVASQAAGSVPFLIRQGENGLCYSFGDTEGMCQMLRKLLEQPQEQKRMGTAAYDTVAEHWNARTAARRLLKVCQSLLSGDGPEWYPDGPCSKAEGLKEG